MHVKNRHPGRPRAVLPPWGPSSGAAQTWQEKGNIRKASLRGPAPSLTYVHYITLLGILLGGKERPSLY